MDKRMKLSGFIDFPEGFDKLGDDAIGTIVTITGKVEITGDHTDRKGRIEDGGELVRTWTATMQAGGRATAFEQAKSQDTLDQAVKD